MIFSFTNRQQAISFCDRLNDETNIRTWAKVLKTNNGVMEVKIDFAYNVQKSDIARVVEISERIKKEFNK